LFSLYLKLTEINSITSGTVNEYITIDQQLLGDCSTLCVMMITVEGVVMVAVVVLSRRFHINPDNVATPIAASLGDLTTISLLAALARGLYSLVDTSSCAADASCSKFKWCFTCVLSIFLCTLPDA